MTNANGAFTGRQAELRFIADCLRGTTPRSVVITGSAGIGKSRLAREAVAQAQDAGRSTCWAAGTSAAQTIPLGALAHLVPVSDTTSSLFTLLQRAVFAFTGDGQARRLVGVDDAHLLDEVSMTLLHQIALSGTAALVLVVPSDSPVPAPIAALWKDALAHRLELSPLRQAETRRLVHATLGNIVTARTTEHLWRLSRGNPLYLRELIEAGRVTGRLRIRDGVWHWEGGLVPTSRLTEVVQAHLGELGAGERTALDVLAVGGPLPLVRLLELADAEAVAALERRMLIVVQRTGRTALARIAHPLHGEVVRARIPEAARGRLCRLVAERCCAPPATDPLRVGVLLLDSDQPQPDVDLLMDGAEQALARRQCALAERLARTAIEGGGGFPARLALIQALHWQGRSVEAEQVAAEATTLIGCADDAGDLAVVRSLNLVGGFGKADTAATALQQVDLDALSEPVRRDVTGARILLAYLIGGVRDALDLAGPLRARTGDPSAPGSLVAAALATALATSGRFDDALATAASGWAMLERCRTATAAGWSRIVLAHAELLALELSGRIRELRRRATQLYQDCLSGPEGIDDAVSVLHLGQAALAAGQPRTAVRWLTEAAACLGRLDPVGLRGMCADQLVQAHALLGDEQPVGETPSGAAPGLWGGGHAQLAQAWNAAARDELVAAADRALLAAAEAAESGQWALEARALHVAVRFGGARRVADRLRTLVALVDGPLVQTYALHAEAAVAGLGSQLEEVAGQFERMGLGMLAADAAGQAAAAHERAGERRGAAVATARARDLARSCESPRTPALAGLASTELTSREEEVARLALAGLTNQAIAERLVLSRRTVEAHLANVYAKLGINSRVKLRAALGRGAAAPVSEPGSRLARPPHDPRPRHGRVVGTRAGAPAAGSTAGTGVNRPAGPVAAR
ncbi:LuxR C-terminal-related transcriptional regulator [Pseudonocardia hispaniensis]|uniref:LuxR C-terminal-related transcriptional regulator n=1 Tax=Pseudonocardia hispaniensis TaxID=904933 RepID=A0ABW1J2M1_9PSEU